MVGGGPGSVAMILYLAASLRRRRQCSQMISHPAYPGEVSEGIFCAGRGLGSTRQYMVGGLTGPVTSKVSARAAQAAPPLACPHLIGASAGPPDHLERRAFRDLDPGWQQALRDALFAALGGSSAPWLDIRIYYTKPTPLHCSAEA